MAPTKITDVEKAIGEYCASLVQDGDCMQLGIGVIPDAVLLFLGDKRNLGIHSKMFSDGVVELVGSGVINNASKNFHKGKMVATFFIKGAVPEKNGAGKHLAILQIFLYNTN